MAMSINTNSTALTAQRNIAAAGMRSSSSLAKLSSGSRVPSAKDDVAALAVGTKLKSEVAGLRQAQQNVGQGVSLLQIADGAMNTISDMLTRMKSLAVQASSGQLTDADRTLLNNEYTALATEIDRVATDTTFNGTALINGATTVSSNVNNTGANNLVNEGIQDIEFADDFGSGAISIAYNATTDVMTVTNEVSGASQSVGVAATAVASGDLEAVAFNSIGVTLNLNDQFDKTTNIGGTNTFAQSTPGFTAGAIEAGSIDLTGIAIGGTTDANTMDIGRLEDVTIEITGAAATTTFTIEGQSVDGSTLTLTGAADLSSVGTKAITMDDANGNSISIELVVDTLFAGTAAAGPGANTITMAELGQTVGARSVATSSTAFSFKVGTGTAANDDIAVTVGASSFSDLAGAGAGDVTSAANAGTAIGVVDTAINQITDNRAVVGAAQSRLEFAGASIATATENTLSAQSAMLDVDVSTEMTEFTSSQVLLQAGISMLSQANQQPSLLLGLLQ